MTITKLKSLAAETQPLAPVTDAFLAVAQREKDGNRRQAVAETFLALADTFESAGLPEKAREWRRRASLFTDSHTRE